MPKKTFPSLYFKSKNILSLFYNCYKIKRPNDEDSEKWTTDESIYTWLQLDSNPEPLSS